jgi:hypothetical protein
MTFALAAAAKNINIAAVKTNNIVKYRHLILTVKIYKQGVDF